MQRRQRRRLAGGGDGEQPQSPSPPSSPARVQHKGLLTCRKCRSQHTDFTLLQTRGADEPMTAFAVCLDCGNRWKQS